MYENPSAGKFDPPPTPRDPTAPTPIHKRWWFVVLLFLTSYPIAHWFLASRWAAIGPLLGLGFALVHYALQFIDAKARGADQEPYSQPTNLTR